MGFFNTLKDLTTDKKEFRQWEESNNNIDAKRAELYQKKHFSPEEIARAKKLGQTITDVVDIMDQHSEDVSEDVETGTQPLVGLAPFITWGGAGFLSYKFLLQDKFKNYVENTKKILKEHDVQNLINTINQNNLVSIKGKTQPIKINEGQLLYSAFNKNKKFLKKLYIEDQNIKQQLTEIVEKVSKEYSKISKPLKHSFWGTLAAGALAFVGMNILATKAQLHGSRIGRYQAREKLQDEKYFVQYTDEQIAQAKENLRNKKPEKRGLFSFGKKDKHESDGWWKNMWNIITKSGKYNRWKKADRKANKLITRELSKEEIAQAKADQEIIQRVVRKINNKAEEYSENMETAATTVLLSGYLGGAAIGAGSSWLLNKFGLAEKFIKNKIGKVAGDKGIKLVDEIIKSEAKPRGIFSKIGFLFSEKSPVKKLHNLILENLGKTNAKENLINATKSLAYTAMSFKFSRNWIIAGATTVVSGLVGLCLSLKLQKNAARAGRFIAKQELLNDPRNFIAHDEQDLEMVKDIKATKKSFGQKLKEYLLFVPTSIKQYFAYEKYKKTKLKETRDLKEELIKLDVSKEQLKEAKNLQRKLFNTFEKVDDKSQEYSETMEVINEVGQTTLSHVPNVIIIGGPLLLIAGIASGKINLIGLGRKVLSGISSMSWFAKSKLVRKHLSQMSDNLVTTVQNTKLDSRTPKTWIALVKEYIPSPKRIKQLYSSSDNFFVEAILKHIPEQKLQDFASNLHNIDDKLLAELLSKKPSELPAFVNKLDDKSKLKKPLTAIINEFNIDEFPQKAKEYLNMPIGEIFKSLLPKSSNGVSIMQKITHNKPAYLISSAINRKTLTNYLRKIVENIPDDKISKINSNLDNLSLGIANAIEFGTISKAALLKDIGKLEKILDNLPEAELKKLTDTYFKLLKENPKELIYLTTKRPEKFISTFNTPVLQNTMLALGLGTATGTIALTYTIASLLAKLQKDAGRFGVMKAMKDLEDYRYYANSEPETITNNSKNIENEKNEINQNKNKLSNNQQEFFQAFLSNKLKNQK